MKRLSINWDKVHKKYVRGMTLRELGDELNCNKSTVANNFRKNGLAIRKTDPGHSRRKAIKYSIKRGCHICTSHAKNRQGYPVIYQNQTLLKYKND